MRVGAAVVARMGSTRLPGKTLRNVAGRPLLRWVMDRVEQIAGFDSIVVATSTASSDAAIASWCAEEGIGVCRGPEADVLGRLILAAEENGFDAVARINADSPWVDPALTADAVERMRESGVDFVSNLVERSWPYGVAVEVARIEALREAHAIADSPAALEHPTHVFYEHPHRFSILSLRLEGRDCADLRLTIDTEEDLQRFERLIRELGDDAVNASTAEVAHATRRLQGGCKSK